MRQPRRVRIGGWASLGAALAIPLEIAALFTASGSVQARLESNGFLAAESIRIALLLVAVIGLDPLFRAFEPRLASLGAVEGGIGLTSGLAINLLVVGPSEERIALLAFLLINGLFGAWYILVGACLMKAGGNVARIGWMAQVGGLAVLLMCASLLVPVAPDAMSARLPQFFVLGVLLSAFAIAFLVRIWRFAAFGRLPVPGLF